MIRWKLAIALTWFLGAAAVVPACGHETIDLAATTDGQKRPDGGGTTTVDPGTCKSHCEALGGACVVSTGKCGTCNENVSCTNSFLERICDAQTHECTMCTETAHCQALNAALVKANLLPPGINPVCDLIAKRCSFPCSGGGCPAPLECDETRGVCVQCLTEDTCRPFVPITFAPYCVKGRCVACEGEGDCGPERHCLPGPQECVDCFDDTHCDANEQCNYASHVCVPRQG